MDSKPERPQGFVFAKQATAADVAGGGSSWQHAVVASGKQGSQRLPVPAGHDRLNLFCSRGLTCELSGGWCLLQAHLHLASLLCLLQMMLLCSVRFLEVQARAHTNAHTYTHIKFSQRKHTHTTRTRTN